jgi:hypothetical protein
MKNDFEIDVLRLRQYVGYVGYFASTNKIEVFTNAEYVLFLLDQKEEDFIYLGQI